MLGFCCAEAQAPPRRCDPIPARVYPVTGLPLPRMPRQLFGWNTLFALVSPPPKRYIKATAAKLMADAAIISKSTSETDMCLYAHVRSIPTGQIVRQGRAGPGRAGQGRAGQGRAGQGGEGQGKTWVKQNTKAPSRPKLSSSAHCPKTPLMCAHFSWPPCTSCSSFQSQNVYFNSEMLSVYWKSNLRNV